MLVATEMLVAAGGAQESEKSQESTRAQTIEKAQDSGTGQEAGPADDATALRARTYKKCVLIEFEGEIFPPRTRYLLRQLATAKAAGADLIIVKIDSPGGIIDDSLELAHELRKISWARTVAYVPKQALSGAAIISLGCDEILLHSDAHFGDAGPISFDVELWSFRHADEKIRSHLARHVRDLASAKGRPPSVAEAMVDKDLEVFQVRHRTSGITAFLSAHELESPENRDQWETLGTVLEARKGRFLEVNGERAVELRLAQAVVADQSAVLERFGIQGPPMVLSWTSSDSNNERLFQVAMFLNIPLIAGLLIIVGIIGILVELTMPGTAVGGIVGAICFALFFWSHYMEGTSGWLEVILFLLGAICLLLEIFVLPGFGVCGFAGIAMIAISLLLAGQNFVIPSNGEELSQFMQWLLVLACSATVVAITTVIGSRYVRAVPIFNRLVLPMPAESSGEKAVLAGKPSLQGIGIGARGTAQTLLRPGGKVRFGDLTLDVISDGAFVEKGEVVVVTEVLANRILVRVDTDV